MSEGSRQRVLVSCVFQLLNTVVPRIDPCDYERLYFVFGLLRWLEAPDDDGYVKRGMIVIELLRGLEDVGGTTTGREAAAADGAARGPLPFHTLMSDPWAVIGPQVRACHRRGAIPPAQRHCGVH